MKTDEPEGSESETEEMSATASDKMASALDAIREEMALRNQVGISCDALIVIAVEKVVRIPALKNASVLMLVAYVEWISRHELGHSLGLVSEEDAERFASETLRVIDEPEAFNRRVSNWVRRREK